MDEFKLAFISSSSNSAETWHMEKKKRKEEKLLNITSFFEWMVYCYWWFKIITIIVIINMDMMIKNIKGSGGKWMANLRFSSVPLHPLKPITILKNVNQYSWLSFFLGEHFHVIPYEQWFNDFDGYMVCNLHDKLRTCYASKVGLKN